MREISPASMGLAGMNIAPLYCLHCRLTARGLHLSFLFLSSPLCGEGSARSLQDNSKIRNSLFLLMSGGRSWYPV
ncbi:hypothetical protein AH818_04990 [Salmonella enterica subsp. enterica]|nr:hypothetical protein [Salmonella enterica subsp. enterica serovar Umbilo]ECC3862195.1 hypothetical protein [Salmonella enterica subsp. enterica]EBU6478343.1 hypothetical protein [Salmonella enterica subsp. enterica serovar Umbilo]EBW4548886.1 hypothetical protein [Salmonella enterica subsp. enterica serovar Umbilo]EBW6518303.1 hypothetical protein [Salmonella enterica subsp. enterica serovar Umbilo]